MRKDSTHLQLYWCWSANIILFPPHEWVIPILEFPPAVLLHATKALALRAARSPCTHPSVLSQVLGDNCCTASNHAHAGKSPSSAVPDTPASSLRSSASPSLGCAWKINVLVESSVPFALAKAGVLGCCQRPGPRDAPGLYGVCCKAEPVALRRAALRRLDSPFPQATAVNSGFTRSHFSCSCERKSSVFWPN